MFCCLYLPPSPASLFAARPDPGTLELLARAFSPRVEVHRADLVTLDISGLGRLFGSPAEIGREMRRAAAERGMHPHVALAATRTAVRLLAIGRAGLTVVPAGGERGAVAGLPIDVLKRCQEVGVLDAGTAERGGELPIERLRRWGLRTLGELADLPGSALSERLGQEGVRWQRLARGEDLQPLVVSAPEEPFEERVELDWPVEGLEPLSFVLARVVEPLCERLAAGHQAAVVIHLSCRLVSRETESRVLQLPAPMSDAKVLRTLILLHLESHPLSSGVDRLAIRVETTPARTTQFSLLARALPFPEHMATLLARLSALLGERQVGVPALVDSHRPGAFVMTPFSIGAQGPTRDASVTGPVRRPTGPARHSPFAGRLAPGETAPASTAGVMAAGPASEASLPTKPVVALRRFRLPVPARVSISGGRPVRVTTDRRGLEGGVVEAAAGPWRTSGNWWRVPDARVQVREGGPAGFDIGWNRDEWDVALSDGGVYRIYRDRPRDRWFVDGIVD